MPKPKKPKKTDVTLLEEMFARFMPEVRFVDATPKTNSVAGRTRKDIERQTGKKVISERNFKNRGLVEGGKK